MVNYIPDKGDVVWLDFDPQLGNEISKTRPALVISPKTYNMKAKLAVFIPITSKIKGYPFEVAINVRAIQGVALCDQVRSLDWTQRRINKIDILDKKIIQKVLNKLYLLIGF